MTQEIKQFTKYFNDFYGTNGLYPSTRNVSEKEIISAVEQLEQLGHDFAGGDSFDREKVRDIIFTQEEQEKMYEKKKIYKIDSKKHGVLYTAKTERGQLILVDDVNIASPVSFDEHVEIMEDLDSEAVAREYDPQSEIKMFGITTAQLIKTVETAETSPSNVAMSLLSDAQELIMREPKNPRINQLINASKFIIFDYCSPKEWESF